LFSFQLYITKSYHIIILILDNFSSNIRTIKEGIDPKKVTTKENKTISSTKKANKIDLSKKNEIFGIPFKGIIT